jgi:hypothetical protein
MRASHLVCHGALCMIMAHAAPYMMMAQTVEATHAYEGTVALCHVALKALSLSVMTRRQDRVVGRPDNVSGRCGRAIQRLSQHTIRVSCVSYGPFIRPNSTTFQGDLTGNHVTTCIYSIILDLDVRLGARSRELYGDLHFV